MNESLSFEDKLKLESWGLPKYIQLMYEKRGIKTMFPWQVECLSIDGVLDGKNLIYSAPTSAGKTLVAEILCLQSVLEKKKKAIIILPFVSVVREKMFYFQDIVSESGVRVEGFMGSYHPPGGFKSVHIAICTIEKANNLINRLMEEEELSDIGCIVVDELHMLGDPHRGYLLELLLTKLKFITKRVSGINIQIIGMSATLPNLDVIARWLDAALYKTDFRPIPLQEYLKVDKALYSAKNGYLHDIKPSFCITNDPGDVIYLCIDTILMGYSILVFCPTKNWCESLAQQISNEIRQLGGDAKSEIAQKLRFQLNSEGISDILERLKRCPVGLDPNLGRSIAFGVSFHHAGLTLDERDIVEGSFKEGLLRVLVATTTLSSGVNLPARRVLVRSPLFNSRPLDVLTYKQMVGRAGRMGRDSEGESYLICSDKDKECGKNLISSDLPPVSSCLASSDLSSSLTRAILEVVASGVAQNKEEIEEYAACTLVHACDPDSLIVPLATCLSYLETNEFTRSLQDGSIAPSPLAQATLSASMYPHQAVKLLQELHKASSSFILNNHLHAIYQVTPYSVSDQWSVDWVKMFDAWEELSPDMKAVGYLVGVEESFLVRAIRTNVSSDKNIKRLSIHRRFYTALALQDLINEVPLSTIAEKFSCNKGMLQSLQQSASTFAGMVTRFCERLGWSGLEAILEQLSSRIEYGAQRDLLDLLRLDCFTAQIARALYSCGIKTVPELASASSRAVQFALTKLVPFLSDEMKLENKNSKCIWVNGKSGLTEAEAAQYFIGRARKFLLEEMGVSNAKWRSEESKDIDSIYLNSTVNPYELMKDLNGTKRKLSIIETIEPINNSTPVSSSGSRRKSVLLSTSKRNQVSKYLNNTDEEIKENSIINNERFALKNFRTSSPLNLEQVNEDLQNIYVESPIVVKELNANLRNDEDSFVKSNTNVIASSSVKESSKVNIPNNATTSKNNFIKPTRLSMGDLFESFDGANFNDLDTDKEEVENENNIDLCVLQSKESNSIRNSGVPKTAEPLVQENELSNIKIVPDKTNEVNVELAREFESDSTEQNGKGISSINSKIDKSKTRNSLDMFFDSFSFNNSSFSQAVVAICEDAGNVLEELDCNWGGESILETSLILTNISKQYSPVSLKRKLSISGEIMSKKRRKKCVGYGLSEPSTSGLNKLNDTNSKIGQDKNEDKVDNSLPVIKNRKQFKKISSKISSVVATSTQKPFETSKLAVVNFELGTCSEISVINKNDNKPVLSSSDDSIIESPTLQIKANKRTKSTSRLQVSNVIKNDEKCKSFTGKSIESTTISNNKHQLSAGLTDSYLAAAFGETFSMLTSPSELESKKNPGGCAKVLDKTKNIPSHDIPPKIPSNQNVSKEPNVNGKKLSANPLKRLRSTDIIMESQDVFMTPPRDLEVDNSLITDPICIKTPTKTKNLVDSPIKTFKDRQRRDSSVSPRRSKKDSNYDSPSKYNKLNIKIVKTPEKSTSNDDPTVGNVTPTKIKADTENGVRNDEVNGNTAFKIKDNNGTPSKINNVTDNQPPLEMANTLLICKTPSKSSSTSNYRSSSCKKSLKMNDRMLFTSNNPPKINDNKLNCLLSTEDPLTNCKSPSKLSDPIEYGSRSCKKSLQMVDKQLNENIKPSKIDGSSNGRTISKINEDSKKSSKTISKMVATDSSSKYLESNKSTSSNNETPFQISDNNSKSKVLLKDETRVAASNSLQLNEIKTNINSKLPNENNCDNSKDIYSAIYNEEIIEEKINNQKLPVKSNPQLIFPCQSSELLREFEDFLSNCTDVAISLDVSRLNDTKSRIGSKIRRQKSCDEDNAQRKFTVGSLSLDGLAFYSGQDVYYVNLLCPTGLCLDILVYVLNRSDINLVLFNVREKLKMLYECCGITVECHLVDPLIADWLLDPQEKAKSLLQLVKDYSEMPKSLSVNHNAATDEVIQVWHLMSALEIKLSNSGLSRHFLSIEMPLCQILVHMELTGIGFDISTGEDLMKTINSTMKALEDQAHKIAKRIFNIASRNDLAKVKKILNITVDNEKDHPLMILIRDWRKLHSLKTRNLSALMLDPKERLHPVSDTKTATGRVTLYEPDLQHIPRDFIVGDILFSARSCFIPLQGNIFVGADYCQLELRILAHYSKDEILRASFASEKDVFKDIAANWNQVSIDEVSDEMRHKAKQICYGLIYGMGHACLGEQLGVSATEAATLQGEFKRRYPGVKRFIENTVTDCRKKGYIKTLSGRTRNLTHINSFNPAFSKQGERQAVNSVIQGSASDIAKHALVKIETTLNEIIPERTKVITDQCACHLVLHLHDEFIYEVSSKYVSMFINVMKSCMEECVELTLPLPVKVKSGHSWGLLESVT